MRMTDGEWTIEILYCHWSILKVFLLSEKKKKSKQRKCRIGLHGNGKTGKADCPHYSHQSWSGAHFLLLVPNTYPSYYFIRSSLVKRLPPEQQVILTGFLHSKSQLETMERREPLIAQPPDQRICKDRLFCLVLKMNLPFGLDVDWKLSIYNLNLLWLLYFFFLQS